jgi:hypothetical protein
MPQRPPCRRLSSNGVALNNVCNVGIPDISTSAPQSQRLRRKRRAQDVCIRHRQITNLKSAALYFHARGFCRESIHPDHPDRHWRGKLSACRLSARQFRAARVISRFQRSPRISLPATGHFRIAGYSTALR